MSTDPEDISAALGFVQAVREAELEEWKAAYRKGWRERNRPWTRPPPPSPPLSLALINPLRLSRPDYRRHKGPRHGAERATDTARLCPPDKGGGGP
jgi:hypothetical protein